MLHLATLRSNDQFNTTIYGYSDRFRGVEGTRSVVFMNREDIARLGFVDGEIVDLTTAIDDGQRAQCRRACGSSPTISPRAAAAAYYPGNESAFPAGAPRSEVEDAVLQAACRCVSVDPALAPDWLIRCGGRKPLMTREVWNVETRALLRWRRFCLGVAGAVLGWLRRAAGAAARSRRLPPILIGSA